MQIYLSGGMKGDWQDRVREAAPNISFLDPRKSGFLQEDQYTFWDREAIKQSDMVFAYMEKSNPSGIGLALEVGYAKGIGKAVIFVDESQTQATQASHRFGIVRSFSDVVFFNMADALVFLERLSMTALAASR